MGEAEWERMLSRYMALDAEKNEQPLRFGAEYLAVHEMAEQFFCEKKVELERIYGRPETEVMQEGKIAHEILLIGMKRVRIEELYRNLFEEERIGAVMHLVGKFKGCVIRGTPDYVYFSKGKPLVLIEHKFSHRPTIFPDHHAQANIYGYLLKCMGFDTDRLKYVIAVMPRAIKEIMNLGAELPSRLDALLSELAASAEISGEGGVGLPVPPGIKMVTRTYPLLRKMVARAYPFSQEEAVEKLEWAVDYWLGKREAKPTQNTKKCNSCDLNEKCDAFKKICVCGRAGMGREAD